MKKIDVVTVSSLEKIKGSTYPQLLENQNSMLKNEVFGFQIALKSKNVVMPCCQIKPCGDLQDNIDIRVVELAPCNLAITDLKETCGYYETHEPTLMPDILMPLDDFGFSISTKTWCSLFVTVKGDLKAGSYQLSFEIYDSYNNFLERVNYKLTVIDHNLCEQDIIYTNWMHYDSICHYYNVSPFSEKFYDLTCKYVKSAVEHGMNMLYVPLFTPPLDTRVGGERLTVQLVGVEKIKDSYKFDFSQFKKFIKLMQEQGIKYFEMSHLFTQWGASAAPKIMAVNSGEEKQIFGWQTDAHGSEYTHFLSSFLPELVKVIDELNIREKVFFHVSDEPYAEHLENYAKAAKIIKKYCGGIPYIDAMSSFEIYKQAEIDIPIPSTNSIDEFLKNKVDNLWTYYCTSQFLDGLSNRFISMPLQRTRIIGMQLYFNNIKGFLHWGYNFYGSFLSIKQINPYKDTSAGGRYQSGDAFIVYPGVDGPIDSLRHHTMLEAWQDFRLLKTLETKKGRAFVLDLLKSEGVGEGFYTYPKSAVWHINLRKTVHDLLK